MDSSSPPRLLSIKTKTGLPCLIKGCLGFWGFVLFCFNLLAWVVGHISYFSLLELRGSELRSSDLIHRCSYPLIVFYFVWEPHPVS